MYASNCVFQAVFTCIVGKVNEAARSGGLPGSWPGRTTCRNRDLRIVSRSDRGIETCE